ncbi:MAG: hypothetical protein AB7H43_02145 [Acidimicrobiia bacterium]
MNDESRVLVPSSERRPVADAGGFDALVRYDMALVPDFVTGLPPAVPRTPAALRDDSDLVLLGTVRSVDLATPAGEGGGGLVAVVDVTVAVDSFIGGRYSPDDRSTVSLALRALVAPGDESRMVDDMRRSVGAQYLFFLTRQGEFSGGWASGYTPVTWPAYGALYVDLDGKLSAADVSTGSFALAEARGAGRQGDEPSPPVVRPAVPERSPLFPLVGRDAVEVADELTVPPGPLDPR